MAYEYIIFPSLNPEASRSATTQAASMTQELATHLPLYAAASRVINPTPHSVLQTTASCQMVATHWPHIPPRLCHVTFQTR